MNDDPTILTNLDQNYSKTKVTRYYWKDMIRRVNSPLDKGRGEDADKVFISGNELTFIGGDGT